jgi:hypothetical protein
MKNPKPYQWRTVWMLNETIPSLTLFILVHRTSHSLRENSSLFSEMELYSWWMDDVCTACMFKLNIFFCRWVQPSSIQRIYRGSRR